MKRLLLTMVGAFFLIFLGHLYGINPKSWFSEGQAKLKNAAAYVKGSAANFFKKSPEQDTEKVQQFKKELVDLQKQIQDHLLVNEDHEIENLENSQSGLESTLAQYDGALIRAKAELSPADFQLLQKALEQKQSVITQWFNNVTSIKNKLSQVFREQANRYTKMHILRDNPYKNELARVSRNEVLLPQEQEFIKNRLPMAQKGLEKFFGQSLSQDQLFTMAFSGSGGGYRAMILTLGYLLGLEQLGLYDAFLYSSSLSGSTWLHAPQIQMNKSLQEYKQILLNEIRSKTFDLVKMQYLFSKNDVTALINDVIWPKFLFDLPIGSIDIYGSLLARVFLSTTLKNYQQQYLPDQWKHVKTAKNPFPLYSAVSMHKTEDNDYLYNWYEFNPLEIRNLELNAAIPSYAFGWKFDQGVSKEAAPLTPLGYFMGIWGSAYTVNVKDINAIVKTEIESAYISKSQDWLKKQTVLQLLTLLGQTRYLAKLRVSPAQVHNPFKNMTNIFGWLSSKPYLVFVDAGIAYNIPLRPLLRKERNIEVIFIGDSSSSFESNTELTKAFADADRLYGYKYTRVDQGDTPTLQIYKDLEHDQAPRIIYMNFMKDQKLIDQAKQGTSLDALVKEYDLASFDAAHCLKNEYCGTFNLGSYTEKEFLQLMNIATFNVLANKERIAEFLGEEFGIRHK